MLGKYVEVGSRVELRPIRKDSNIEKTHISKVNQVLGSDKLEILMPIEDSKIVLLARNILYDLYIYSSGGLFQCKVKAGERYKSGNIYLQQLVVLSQIKKCQRREFYRYECAIPISSRHLYEEEKKSLVWNEMVPGVEGETLDIGGGGVRFKTKESYEPGEMMVCILKLPINEGEKEIQTLGKVLSVKSVEFTKYFEVRVQFEKISNKARENIIQYIFEDERKRRKKNSGF